MTTREPAPGVVREASKRPLLFAGEDGARRSPRRSRRRCFKEAPAVRGGRYRQAGLGGNEVGHASKRPLLFAGEDPDSRIRVSRCACQLQRGPCCSRGKIGRPASGSGCRERCFKEAPAVRGGRYDEPRPVLHRHGFASKRPLLFAGEDDALARLYGSDGRASKRPLLFAGEDAGVGGMRPLLCRASKRPLLFAGEDPTPGGRTRHRPPRFKEAPAVRGGRSQGAGAGDPEVGASKRPLLFAGEDADGHVASYSLMVLQRGPCCSRGKMTPGGAGAYLELAASKRPLLFAGEDSDSGPNAGS